MGLVSYRYLIVLCSLLFSVSTSAESREVNTTSPTTIHIMTVVICQQEGFLQYLLQPYLSKKNINIEYSTGHHSKVVQAVKHAEADIVIAHTKVKGLNKQEEAGKLNNGRAVFANPRAFLGPVGDPAGIRGLEDPVKALENIFEQGYCYIINPHGEMARLQNHYLDKVASDNICVSQGPGDINRLLDMAVEKNAYTLWGLHPFVARGAHKLEPIVVPNDVLLENLAAWVVTGSQVEDAARELVNYLVSDEAGKRIKRFRLEGYENVQPWYPPVKHKY